MAYCTVAQVEAEFKDVTFGPTTAVTSTDVTRFIEESDAEINGYIGSKYVVPIDATESLKVVRRISILIVTDRIKEILRVKTGDDKVDQATRGGQLRAQAMAMLKAVLSSQIKLSDAVLNDSGDGVSSFAVDHGLEFEWQKGVDQW